jgi:succinate dehydrogenase / fumarate reductase cytochrome b subunit
MRQRLKNGLGFWGWIGGGRYGMDRYAYSLHRLTGLGILAYFIMHIFVTGQRLGGEEQWENTMAVFGTPLFKAGEFLVVLAFAFHAVNGIRLIFTELGWWIGKPSVPSFPYSYSTLRHKPIFVVVMVLAAVLMIVSGVDFYFVMK